MKRLVLSNIKAIKLRMFKDDFSNLAIIYKRVNL